MLRDASLVTVPRVWIDIDKFLENGDQKNPSKENMGISRVGSNVEVDGERLRRETGWRQEWDF